MNSGYTYCTLMALGSDDPAIARDRLSTNRRLPDMADLELFGTMIVAGPTPDQIFVLIPDSVGTTGYATSADIQHVVVRSLGPAENLNSTLPAEGLHLALCETSVRPTLNLQNHDYWKEVNPILQKWQNVNDASCPRCNRIIRVNMSRHLRSAHTGFQCFLRCPVASCPMWFLSELNGRDHLERIHIFKEGQGYSFYECLRIFSLEWFGRCSFFDCREVTGQSLWMIWPLPEEPVTLFVTTMPSPTVRQWLPCVNSSAQPFVTCHLLTKSFKTHRLSPRNRRYAHKCAGILFRSCRMTPYRLT